MFATSPSPANFIFEKGLELAMSLFVVHFTLPSRECRDVLPCVHGMRPANGGRFHTID